MDLLEITDNKNRHPWEIARKIIVNNLILSIEKTSSDFTVCLSLKAVPSNDISTSIFAGPSFINVNSFPFLPSAALISKVAGLSPTTKLVSLNVT